METTNAQYAISPALQERVRAFEAERDDYLEQQRDFQDAMQETARLRATAEALAAESEEANAAWKEMAKERKADQRKINAQIERSVSLKQQADGLTNTAEVREELHRALAVGLAKARFKLKSSVSNVNAGFLAERLAFLLETPGLKDVLSEIYAISLHNHQLSVSAEENFIREVRGSLKASSHKAFVETLGIDCDKAVPVLASMPPPVKGEVVAEGALPLKRFEEAGGVIPLQPLMPGAIPSKPLAGLKRA